MTALAELSLAGLVAALAGLMLVDGTPLVGLLVPGDIVVVSASSAAGWPAVLVAVVGGVAALVCGHVAGYLLGRHYGAHLWARLGHRIGLARWCRAERTLRDSGDRALVATPFIPLVNTLLPVLAGALGVRPARYLLLIVVADTAWVALWAGVGLGAQQLAVLLGAADVAVPVSVAVSVAVLVVTALVLRHSHRRAGQPVALADGSLGDGPARDPDLPACVAPPVHGAASAITAAHRDPPDHTFTVTTGEPVAGMRVVTATGEASIRNSPVLDAALRAQTTGTDPPEHLVVDLSGIRFLNYHAVVALVAAHRAARRAGTAFHLVGTGARAVHRPLRIAGVLARLDCGHASPAAVLADHAAPPARPGDGG